MTDGFFCMCMVHSMTCMSGLKLFFQRQNEDRLNDQVPTFIVFKTSKSQINEAAFPGFYRK